jgi:hypothetical protein
MFVFNFSTTGIGGLSLTEARTVMIKCLILLFQVAGNLYLTLKDSDQTTVICYKVAVRVVYSSKLLKALQP